MSIEMTAEEILHDIRTRMERAVQMLRANADSNPDYPDQASRLRHKADGVALAVSYLGDYAIAPPAPQHGRCSASRHYLAMGVTHTCCLTHGHMGMHRDPGGADWIEPRQ